ncbi:MAG: acyl-protein synthetase [Myxococcota bacterium]
MSDRQALEARVRRLIASPQRQAVDERDHLIEDIASWQSENIAEYSRLTRSGPWPPALPTDVFRMRRIAAHTPKDDIRTFRSSGTTASDRSTHAFRDLGLYDAAARAAARTMLFPDVDRMRLIVLAPHEAEAPQSSLSYMLTRFTEWFGTKAVFVWTNDALEPDRLRDALYDAANAGEPVALLGTSFAFVHAEDTLGDFRIQLPEASRLMQTGGYKGRSREVKPATLRSAMVDRYGIDDARIVAEYGMTELSSQMYETTLVDSLAGHPSDRRLWTPPWVRATPVDPDDLSPVKGEGLGVLRIDDCANLDSVCCIQTADLGRRVGDGIIVEGRAPGAAPRGCSLAADQALGTGDA